MSKFKYIQTKYFGNCPQEAMKGPKYLTKPGVVLPRGVQSPTHTHTHLADFRAAHKAVFYEDQVTEGPDLEWRRQRTNRGPPRLLCPVCIIGRHTHTHTRTQMERFSARCPNIAPRHVRTEHLSAQTCLTQIHLMTAAVQNDAGKS